jgi:hypothetical protein
LQELQNILTHWRRIVVENRALVSCPPSGGFLDGDGIYGLRILHGLVGGSPIASA